MKKRAQRHPPKKISTAQAPRQISWVSWGWWSRTPLSAFSPLLAFANTEQIDGNNWENVLWQAMGREQMYWATPRKDSSTAAATVKIFAADIGDGSDFENIRPYRPKVFGQEATLPLTKKLQSNVRQILDFIFAKSALVDRQRRGEDAIIWRERVKQRDVVFGLTGHQSDYSHLPWEISHFEEYKEILDHIQDNLEVTETRKAIIHSSVGFIQFENHGEDAATTLGWMLMGLVDVVFDKERVVLRKCLRCEMYFVHETLKPRKFCSDKCRYNHRHDINALSSK